MTEIEKQLIIENKELHFRLMENEKLIHALQKNKPEAIVDPEKAPEISLATKNQYQIIVNEINDGACTISNNETILYCNQQFADFISIPVDDIIGSNFVKLIAEKDKSLLDLLMQARQKGKSNGVITYIRNPGILKYFFLSISPIPSTLPGELFVLITDITELKQDKFINEIQLSNARLSALNIMEDEIAAKKALANTNRKLVEEIKERKKAACELQQSRRNLLEAQKMARIGNWSYNPITREATFSEELYRIFGLDPKLNLPGHQEFKKCVHPEDWELIKNATRASLGQGIIKEVELRLIRADGIACTVYVICTPQFNHAGKAININGTIQDITERKQTEKELLKMNRLYTVISQINQMIVHNQVRETIFTEACNIVVEHGKFRMAWIGLLDENEKTIIPVTWAGAELGYLNKIKIAASNTPLGNGPTGTAIRKGEHYYCNDIATDPKMEVWREEALSRNYRSSIALPIRIFNNIIGAFTIYVSEPDFFTPSEIDLLIQVTNDISFALGVVETEKKRLKAEKDINNLNTELEQRVTLRTIQLEQTNKELEAFTYSVSHDLRSPLHNINGWSQVLQDECKEQLGENGIKYLDRVLAETRRMNNLIEDLLKLSKVTLVEKKKETVDLTSLARNILQRILDKSTGHQPEIIIQPGMETVGDPRLLDIALTNLFDNAYKFTGKQPQPRIEFGKSIKDGKPTYWVKDNGVGFDMQHSKNLFGVFQRMHKQTDFPGTGIGLATVQRIIHRHDGLIWAESAINQGTTFYFTIPERTI